PKSGWELSSLTGIDFNTTNPGTDYKSGDDFHVDFLVANHVIRAIITPQIQKALEDAKKLAEAVASGKLPAPPPTPPPHNHAAPGAQNRPAGRRRRAQRFLLPAGDRRQRSGSDLWPVPGAPVFPRPGAPGHRQLRQDLPEPADEGPEGVRRREPDGGDQRLV